MCLENAIQQLHIEILVIVVVDLNHRGLSAGRQALGLEQGELAVRARVAGLTAELLLEVLLDRFATAQVTRKSPTDPNDVLAHRLIEEHRVEGDDAFHDRRRQLETLRHVLHHLGTDPSVLSLTKPQHG